MYVTKSNMATAVSNLTKHLEHVSEALAVSSICSQLFLDFFLFLMLNVLPKRLQRTKTFSLDKHTTPLKIES